MALPDRMAAAVPQPDCSVRQRLAGVFLRERNGKWAPYFWHGMSAGVWWALLRRNRFAISLNCSAFIVLATLTSVVNSVLNRCSERVFARRLATSAVDCDDPIFILGHWRSGTTHLHNLLACDPGLAAPSTYACMFPGHFLLTERLGRLLFSGVIPVERPMDAMRIGVELPQEEEFALCNLGARSPYLMTAAPRHGPVDEDYLDLCALSGSERAAWMETFAWFIKRVAWRQKTRLVLKSPANTARIATLLEMFPKAKFVFIARDPLAVYPSTMRLWRSLNASQGIHNPPHDEKWLPNFVLSTFEKMFACYQRDKTLIPPGHLVEVTYEALTRDPAKTLEHIYRELGLAGFEDTRPHVEAHLATVGDYQTNQHNLAPDMAAIVSRRWRDYAEYFRYGEPVAVRTPPGVP